jgi:hypothetical protein
LIDPPLCRYETIAFPHGLVETVGELVLDGEPHAPRNSANSKPAETIGVTRPGRHVTSA